MIIPELTPHAAAVEEVRAVLQHIAVFHESEPARIYAAGALDDLDHRHLRMVFMCIEGTPAHARLALADALLRTMQDA